MPSPPSLVRSFAYSPSSISWYISPPCPANSLSGTVSRMAFSIIFANSVSNRSAALRSSSACSACFASATAAGRMSKPPSMSDHDQFRAQRTRLAQRFENGDQVAGRGADVVDGAHDVLELRALLEHEHACLLLFDAEAGVRHDGGVALAEGIRLRHADALLDGH